MPYAFSYFIPTRVFFGKDCLNNNYATLSSLGEKALIISGRKSAKACGAYDETVEVLNKLNIESVLYDQIEENPSFSSVQKAVEFGLENDADFVIGIGGGSPIDAAKAVAVLIANPFMKIEDLFDGDFDIALPIVAIPTTSGTGSEVTEFSVLNSPENRKKSFKSDVIFPDISFIDPKYTLNLSSELTITTACDALSHSIEGSLSLKSTILTDLYAAKAIELIKENLPKLVNSSSVLSEEEKYECRQALSLASMLGGMVISQTGTVLPHSFGYNMTTFYGLRHGVATIIFLPSVLRKAEKTNPEKLDIFKDSFKSVDKFDDFLEKLGVYKNIPKLSEKDLVDFSQFVAKSMHVSVTPGNITYEDIVSIYKEVCG